MHGDEGILEIPVHDEVRIRQPDVAVVMNRVQVVVLALVRVPKPWVVPLLLQQELYFVFLKEKVK